jgi:hypothetical protein
MGGIDDETYLVLFAKLAHGLSIHCPINSLAVMQRDVLLTRLRTIEEW